MGAGRALTLDARHIAKGASQRVMAVAAAAQLYVPHSPTRGSAHRSEGKSVAAAVSLLPYLLLQPGESVRHISGSLQNRFRQCL